MAKGIGQSWLGLLVLVGAAILCGTGVWLVVQFTETEEINLNVEVYATGVDSTVDLNLRTREVLVRFSYPAIEAQRMKSEDFYVEMDFSDLKGSLARKLEDSGERPVYEEMVESKIGMEQYNIQPVSVLKRQVKWEAQLRSAMANVIPRVTGKPADGFKIDEFVVEDGKDEVRVLLHQWKAEEFAELGVESPDVPTEPIDVSGARDVISAQVKLAFPDGLEPVPGEEEHLVTVIVVVSEETVKERLTAVPLNYQFVSSGKGLLAEVKPASLDIVVEGKRSAVQQISPDDIRINLFGVVEKPGEATEVPVDVVLNNYELRPLIDHLVAEPRTVTVTILQDPSFATPTPTPVPEVTPSVTEDGSTTATLNSSESPVATPTAAVSDEDESDNMTED